MADQLTEETKIPLEKLKEILKIRFDQHPAEMQTYLKARRKHIGDIFYSKDSTQAQKDELFDELTEMCKYFGHKLPFKKGNRPAVTLEQRISQTEAFFQYCEKKNVYPDAKALALVWVNAR